MASVNDVGVPGQPATNLTAWQKSVRDAFNSSDVTVDARIAATRAAAGSLSASWSGTVNLSRQGRHVTCRIEGLQKSSAPTALETAVTIPTGYKPVTSAYVPIPTIDAVAATGQSILYASGAQIKTWSPAPLQTFKHYAVVTWWTDDAMPA